MELSFTCGKVCHLCLILLTASLMFTVQCCPAQQPVVQLCVNFVVDAFVNSCFSWSCSFSSVE